MAWTAAGSRSATAATVTRVCTPRLEGARNGDKLSRILRRPPLLAALIILAIGCTPGGRGPAPSSANPRPTTSQAPLPTSTPESKLTISRLFRPTAPAPGDAPHLR